MPRLKDVYDYLEKYEKMHYDSDRKSALAIMLEKLRYLREIYTAGKGTYDEGTVYILEVSIAGLEGQVYNLEHPNNPKTVSSIHSIIGALEMIKDRKLKSYLKEKEII